MDVDFECTQCGKCCHNLKLPLTVKEAITWLSNGHDVQIICEALTWESDLPTTDLRSSHKRRRTFVAVSGSMPIRVDVILAASFNGACPHLQEDMRCGNYSNRPLVCRIYPAEISPVVQLNIAEKACPPDAWTGDRPSLLRGGSIVDADLLALIQESRDTDVRDIGTKEKLCAALELDAVALTGEGFVIHSPDRADLLVQLLKLQAEGSSLSAPTDWRIVSDQEATRADLSTKGAASALASTGQLESFEYLGFLPSSQPQP